MARLTHLNQLGKALYFRLFRPRDGQVLLTLEGISAQFHVKSYTELLYLTERIGKDERRILEFMGQLLQPGDVVYDVGAYLGLHTIFFAKRVGEQGRVVSFEPMPYNYQALEANIELNGLKNVFPMQIALGDTASGGTSALRQQTTIHRDIL